MKTKLTALFLAVIMIASVFSLSSCYLLNDGVIESLLSSDGNGNINVEGGDTNNITINGDASNDILVASKALLASVSLVCEFSGRRIQGSGVEKYYSLGSGVIYKLDKAKGEAYIITNYHVVYDSQSATANKISDNISVMLFGQEYSDYMMKASFIGGSSQYDIAVLKITASEHLMKSSAVAADFADSNAVSVLEKVVAIGNPGGDGISATVGYVNVDSEEIDLDNDGTDEFRVIRTDAAVNSGNSGGGLFNAKGEVVGIVNAKMADNSVDNIGYAIPSNIAKAVADNILYYCDGTSIECPRRVLMGITVTHTNLRSEYDTATGKVRRFETVIVDSVNAGSAVTGLIAKGDAINSITIDGVKYEVTRIFHVVDSMLNARVGSSVTINITRAGESFDVAVPIVESMLTDWK